MNKSKFFSPKFIFIGLTTVILSIFIFTVPNEDKYIALEVQDFVSSVDENNLQQIKCSTSQINFPRSRFFIEFSSYNDDEWLVDSTEKEMLFEETCINKILSYKENPSYFALLLNRCGYFSHNLVYSSYDANYDCLKREIFDELKKLYPYYVKKQGTVYDAQGNVVHSAVSVTSGGSSTKLCPDYTSIGFLGYIKRCY